MATQAEQKKQLHRLLIIVAAVSLSLLVIAAVLPLLFGEDAEPDKPPAYSFADPSLSADPSSDTDYMSLDRTVYYRALAGYEVTVSVREEELASFDAEVALLYRLIQAAMAGDSVAYNACFSPEFVAASGATEAFTKQKLYDITLTLYDSSELNVPVGYSSVRAYGVAYKIKDNNGSLRDDMGSDAVKGQIFLIVKDASGKAAVYGVRLPVKA